MMRIFFRSLLVVAVLAMVGCAEHGVPKKIKVGDRAPKSNNQVVANEKDWEKVSTMDTKARLYRWKIAEMVEQGKPFLVVFGTPQHCSMCVDQLTRVAAMEEKYGEQFAFIHVDGYKDSAVWVQWGVKGEPWTYMVDAKGVVRQLFPGPMELPLLEENIQKLMQEAA